MRSVSRLAIGVIFAHLAACALPGSRLTADSTVINNAELTEISGMAASGIESGQYWVINDSGHTSAIYLINRQAETLKKVTVNAHNRDWEDLASYTIEGISWLMIADSGDNRRRHSTSFLHFFQESDLLEAKSEPVSPEFSLEYRYSKGPQNCEAVAVDPDSRKILFLSKSSANPELFELDLPTQSSSVKPIAQHTANLPAFTGEASASMLEAITGFNPDVITGMDIMPDNTGAVVLTYRDVWAFRKPEHQAWKTAFSSSAEHLSAIRLRQAEAIAVDRDSSTALVTSEGQPSPLIQLALPKY